MKSASFYFYPHTGGLASHRSHSHGIARLTLNLTDASRQLHSKASHRSHRSHGIARLTLNLTEASRQLHSKGSHRSHRSHGIACLMLNLTDASVSGGVIWGCCGGGKHLFHPFKSNLHLFKINYKNR